MNLIILISILPIISGPVFSATEKLVTTKPESAGVDKFPDDFLFGAATSAYQIEGAWNVSNKGKSIWDLWSHEKPSVVYDETNGDVAANSYYLYKTDVDLVKQLGANSYRVSLSWSRILPTGFDDYVNEDGIRYYNDLFDEMLKKNITPFVTIYHWDLPLNLENLGGWANPSIVDWFVDYARVVFNAFGAKVKLWGTYNEPMFNCYYTYNGAWARKNPIYKTKAGIYDFLCGHHALLAHAKTYQLYKKNFRATQKGEISIIIAPFSTIPRNPSDPEDVEANNFYLRFRNDWFLHPIFSKKGDYPQAMKDAIANHSAIQGFPKSRLPEFTKEEIVLIKNSADFLVINYYTIVTISKFKNLDIKKTVSFDADVGARHYFTVPDTSVVGYENQCTIPYCQPWGLSLTIHRITRKYDIPKIVIGENGYMDYHNLAGLNDIDRAEYHYYHLKELLKLIKEGINIKGYYVWSLIDLFEFSRGYTCNYGIYAVNFTDPNRTRTPKIWSTKLLKEIYTTKTIPSSFTNFVNQNRQ
ncbi:myrosinase 1 [Microplitis demolitor]|uniref:myrosinase 1 n=1 Tax=Microplitis demolitor TaxID=69319 RepID=UPI0004CCF284|nr:myrosinase 1 [Microplitis demolitor]